MRKDTADQDHQEFLGCLSSELVLHSFSQNAGELLKKIRGDKDKCLFIFKGFVLSRLWAFISCLDLFDACPDLNIDPVFIRSCALSVDHEVSEEEAVGRGFVNAIKRDDLNRFIDYVEKEGYPIDEMITVPTGYRINYGPFFSLVIRSVKRRAEDFEPMGLAALFGSVNIFKYILLKCASISNSVMECAYYGGNEQIIHILEEIPGFLERVKKENDVSLSKRLPYLSIFEYMKNNYWC